MSSEVRSTIVEHRYCALRNSAVNTQGTMSISLLLEYVEFVVVGNVFGVGGGGVVEGVREGRRSWLAGSAQGVSSVTVDLGM